MYAFKTSGNRGQYDVIDEFDVIEFYNSLPLHHDPIPDLQQFKDFQAWYFTPSNLKIGTTRSKDNIKDVQAIVFDLDDVPDWNEYLGDVLKMATTGVEFATWQTPSSIGHGKHKGGMRLYFPLAVPIMPELLSQAVDELVVELAKIGFNLLNYGADLPSSRTIGRLMGLPLQRYMTFINSSDQTWKYQVTSQYEPPKPKKQWTRRTNMKTSPEDFVRMYIKKHDVPQLVLGVNVHNILQQLIGALERAGFTEDEAMEGLEFLSDATENGLADIEKEVATSNAYKGG